MNPHSAITEASQIHSRKNFSAVLVYLGIFLAIFLIGFSISPMNDDWYYLTAPNPDFKLADLLPRADFWRPFDALFGAFMGLCPSLFPVLNRFVVVAAHIVNAVLMESIASQLGVSRKWKAFTVAYFLLSSATWVVTLSPDGLNQAYSSLFGLLAVYCHIKKGGYAYLPLCLISLFWKETGISWFFVVPLLDAFVYVRDWSGFFHKVAPFKKMVVQVLLSLLVIAVYFAARFSLYGSVTLGKDHGAYELSLFSISTLINAVMVVASAATGADALALLGAERSMPLAAVTVLLSLVFLAAWLVSAYLLLKRHKQSFRFCCLALCVFCLAFPGMIMGHAGEMQAYPVLSGIALMFAFSFDQTDISLQKLVVPFVCMVLALSVSSAHKVAAIYDYSARTRQLTKNLRLVYDDPDDAALFITVEDWMGYSVFNQSASTGSYVGYSMRPYYDWAELNHTPYVAESQEDAQNYIAENGAQYDSIYIIKDETVQKVK